jgi:hypothetical protein
VFIDGLNFKVSYRGGTGNDVVIYRSPIEVGTIVYDTGLSGTEDDSQCSMITRILVEFRGLVSSLDSRAFTLNRVAGGSVDLAWTLRTQGTSTFADIHFTGGAAVYRSGDRYALNDGKYQFVINGDFLADGTSSHGAGLTDEFFRIFGDHDGDHDVDTLDHFAFRRAQSGAAQSALDQILFDYDGDHDVDSADYRQFRMRLGTRLS